MSWFRKFFGLHEHEWKTIEKKDITRGPDQRIGFLYIQQCQVKTCGKIRHYKVDITKQ